jgi:hypothetical protein
MKHFYCKYILSILVLLVFSTISFAQTTAFNFQGRLNDGGGPANGRYDLRFKLFDSLTGGSQVSTTVDKPNIVLVNGLISIPLDFGPAFTSGDRFIEISLRPNGSPNAYVILGERQQILSVPFAFRATTAAHADLATNAQNASQAVNATNATQLVGIPGSNYARLNFANQGDVSAANLGAAGYVSVGGGNAVIAANGNASQSFSANGFVKAMVEVNGYIVGDIVRCYNGVTGSTSGTCGFTLTASGTGIYNINFNTPINNRFIAITAKYNSSTGTNNIGANYRFSAFNNTTIDVFTFAGGESDDTIMADFTVIVF